MGINAGLVKIWLTYEAAGSLHSSGLEMIQVWFCKPEYHFIKNTRDWEDEDLPFGQENGQREGVQRFGWVAPDRGKNERKSISFGKVFGYESELACYVWKRLQEHFKEEDLRKWYDQEKAGIAKPSDFCLEFDMHTITLISRN